jgi:hypothetical protein
VREGGIPKFSILRISEETDKIKGFVRETAEKIGVSKRTIYEYLMKR